MRWTARRYIALAREWLTFRALESKPEWPVEMAECRDCGWQIATPTTVYDWTVRPSLQRHAANHRRGPL